MYYDQSGSQWYRKKKKRRVEKSYKAAKAARETGVTEASDDVIEVITETVEAEARE